MVSVGFIAPMESLPVKKLPVGAKWTYEIKLDGFRVEAIRTDDGVTLYSRREKDMTRDFREIAKALEYLPPGTVIDGEMTALDGNGLPSFNLLQNSRAGSRLMFFAFDILFHKGKNLTRLPLAERRAVLQEVIKRGDFVELSVWTNDLEELEQFVTQQNLEGIVAKQLESRYEAGRRSGAWSKLRFNRRQEFVIGGYTPSDLGLDALLVGFYAGKELRFAGAVRAGFIPRTRREVHEQLKALEIQKCPFANLPDKRAGTWGQGITAEKMKQCRWLKPTTVAEIEFTEWTPGDRLRGAAFVSLRHDKNPRRVVKEP